jgi:hypothetical protein
MLIRVHLSSDHWLSGHVAIEPRAFIYRAVFGMRQGRLLRAQSNFENNSIRIFEVCSIVHFVT